MGRLNKLTQKHIDNAKPADKPFNLADGGWSCKFSPQVGSGGDSATVLPASR